MSYFFGQVQYYFLCIDSETKLRDRERYSQYTITL